MIAFRIPFIGKTLLTTLFLDKIHVTSAVQYSTATDLGITEFIAPDLVHIPKINLYQEVVGRERVTCTGTRTSIGMVADNSRRRVIIISSAF